jgi:hypothetical protein
MELLQCHSRILTDRLASLQKSHPIRVRSLDSFRSIERASPLRRSTVEGDPDASSGGRLADGRAKPAAAESDRGAAEERAVPGRGSRSEESLL